MSNRNAMPINKFLEEQCNACESCVEYENDACLLFDFDDLRILGVFGDDVHLLGSMLKVNEENDCVLVIKNKLFKSLLNQWLLRKKALCELWEGYCGVGSVFVLEFQHCGEAGLNELNDNVDDDSPYILMSLSVPKFRVTKCYVDIEHG